MNRTKAYLSSVSSPLMAALLLCAANGSAHAASGLAISKSTMTFSAPAGGAIQSNVVTVTSTAPDEEFIINTDGGNWLGISADHGATPATITITANPIAFNSAGKLTGYVQFIAASDFQSQLLTVTFNIGSPDGSGGGGGGAVTPSPTSLTFQYTVGSAAPQPQTITLTGTATFTADAGSSAWLAVSPVSGTSPTTLTVTVTPGTLTAGTYQGTISINAGGSLIPVPVTLIVVTGGGQSITASPPSLSFSQTVGDPTPDAQTLTVDKPGGSTAFAASSNATWLIVSPVTGNTPLSLLVSVNAAGLSLGPHSATITLNGGTSATTVPVTFTLTASSSGGGGGGGGGGGVTTSFTVTPSSLSFSQTLGAAAPNPQILSVKTEPYGTAFTVAWNGSWMRALPAVGLAPADVEVTANASLLTAGTYQGSVVVTVAGQKVTVPVTFVVTDSATANPPTTVDPGSLSFSYNLNGPAPASKTLHVDNPSSSKPFTATATSTGKWLIISPSAGLTPTDITVTVNPTGLAVGTYQGSISVSSGSTTIPVTVSLVVAKVTLSSSVQPSTLGFTGSVGAAAPPPQSVIVSSSGTPFTFSATATTANQLNWLSISPSAGTTPSALIVSVSPAGLPPGQYTGTITITPTDTNIAGSTVSVTFTVGTASPTAPTPIVRSVLNAGSMQSGSVAPGEIVVIKGSNLGPDVGIGPEILSAGAVTSTLRGARVLFDGISAPLMYAQAGQITAIVPYGMYGRFSTMMQVDVSGSKSDPLQLMIENTAPGVFTADGSGSGQATVTNEDGSANSNLHAASRNSLITIWGTGEGQTSPGGQDGRIIATDLRAPLAPVSVKIGGVPVEVRYAGSASGVVSGTLQINAYLSNDVPTGMNVPIEVTIGAAKSQLAATIAVK